jgi:stage II sporulation SpoAA-like protein
MSMPYHLTIQEHPAYLHATVTGTHSPENAMRFLKEVHEACMTAGKTAALLEMNLAGPSLDATSIFRVISERSGEASKLKKIAYVDASSRDPEKMRFAETVAVNRGVNVRLFQDLAKAKEWMSGA